MNFQSWVNFVFDWILYLVVIAVILATLFGLANTARADGGYTVKYEFDAKPFSVRYEFSDSLTASPEIPTLTIRTASWCGKCPGIKKQIVDSGRFKLIEESGENDQSVPSLWWDTSTGRKGFQWNGMTGLIYTWELTTGKKVPQSATKSVSKPVVRSVQPQSNSYNPSWDWPGDLRSHLQSTHGVGNAANLSQDDAERLHDSIHNASGHSGRRKKRR